METVLEKKLEGRHVLYMLLSFFGVMVSVNLVLVYFALTSFSGLSQDDPYNKGINYNQAIEAMEAQQSRNWSISLGVEGPADKTIVKFALSTQGGQPIVAEKVTAVFRHPTKIGQDIEAILIPNAGSYATTIALASAGQWDLYITVVGGGYDVPYRVEKRIWVK